MPTETHRLDVLRSYQILDTPPERAFDRITGLAASFLRAPVAMVSLVDAQRAWFKARVGMPAAEVPRCPGLCETAMHATDVYAIRDIQADPRTASAPPIQHEGRPLRFYAAAPLRGREGTALGTLCVLGPEPRQLTAEEARVLRQLADLVVEELELRRAARQLETRLQETRDVLERRELQHSGEFLAVTADLQRQIAERQRTERALVHTERFFTALIQNGLDVVLVLDPEGRAKFASPSVEHMLGLPPEVLMGQSVFDYIVPEDRGATRSALMRLVERETGAQDGVSGRMMHRDGSIRTFEAIGRNMLADPDVEGIVINARDITARRRLEEQLIEAQRMEGLGQLAGGVAHDFNNILTAILGAASLAESDVAPGHPVLTELLHIREAAHRAGNLTRQLLAFARRQERETRQVDLGALTLQMERMLHRVLGPTTQLRTQVSRGLPPVMVDPTQIEQVILNLVVNARDAMPGGGTITLETTARRIPGEAGGTGPVPPGLYAVLKVRDTGTGIPPEVLPRIFEPFFTTKEQGKGTGLGLSTCYGIVAQSHGMILVDSRAGEGTTFEVLLPAAVEASGPTEGPDARGSAGEALGGTERILLVEDDPGVRRITRRVLQELGYHVEEAQDGEEARTLLARDRAFDLIVSDAVMPRLGGLDLFRHLRREARDERFLLVSGHLHRGSAEEPEHAEVPMLAKPWTRRGLAEAVRGVLDAGSAASRN